MGSEVGNPFTGSVWYSHEATYGGGHGATAYRFSDAVQVCRLESGDINAKLRHTGDSRVTDFVRTLVNPRLHLEYVWQPHNGSTITDFVERTSCDLNSFCVEFGANEGCGTSSYYLCKGCKCDTLNIKASTGEYYMITMDLSVKSVVTNTTSSGTDDPGAIGTTFASFNSAGSITWSLGANLYYVTKSLDVTINNNVNDYWDVGSVDKKAAVPGAKDVTGTMDISMDDGGALHWYRVTNGTDLGTITFDTGCDAGTWGQFVLTNGRFDSTAVENNVSGEGMFDNVPFTFKDVTFATT